MIPSFETKKFFEKSVNNFQRKNEFLPPPALLNIINSTVDENMLQDFIDTQQKDSGVFEENPLTKGNTRRRENSPGLMKLYSTWRSFLIRIKKRSDW